MGERKELLVPVSINYKNKNFETSGKILVQNPGNNRKWISKRPRKIARFRSVRFFLCEIQEKRFRRNVLPSFARKRQFFWRLSFATTKREFITRGTLKHLKSDIYSKPRTQSRSKVSKGKSYFWHTRQLSRFFYTVFTSVFPGRHLNATSCRRLEIRESSITNRRVNLISNWKFQ